MAATRLPRRHALHYFLKRQRVELTVALPRQAEQTPHLRHLRSVSEQGLQAVQSAALDFHHHRVRQDAPGRGEAEGEAGFLAQQRPFAAWGAALLCRSLLDQGQLGELTAVSGTLYTALNELDMLEQEEFMLRTALACRLAVGDRSGAEAIAVLSVARLRRTLGTIEDPALRARLRQTAPWRALVADVRMLGCAVDGLTALTDESMA